VSPLSSTVRFVAGVLLLGSLVSCAPTAWRATVPTPVATSTEPAPPVAKQVAYTVRSPHGDRIDEYYWLRDDDPKQKNAEVMAQLNAENAYKNAKLAHLAGLQQTLFDEIKGRIAQDDSTVPVFDNGYWYQVRYEPGREYPIYARRKGTLEAAEEIVLNGPEMAAGSEFFAIGDAEISPNNRYFAWTEDRTGRRNYTLKVRDLQTGKDFSLAISGIDPGIIWAADSATLFYVSKDPTTLLGNRVFRHRLGQAGADTLVYTEKDPSFYMGLGVTRSRKYLYIGLRSTLESEMRVVRADDPTGAFQPLYPRSDNHEYDADHFNGEWLVRTNWQAPNFRLMTANERDIGDRARWQDVVPHSNTVFIADFLRFNGYLVVGDRSEGLRRIRVIPDRGQPYYIDSDAPAYAAFIDDNIDASLTTLRYRYTSLTTPNSVYDVDLATGVRTLKKQDPVIGDFDASRYQSERLWVTARDGTRVPVSLVYRKDRFSKNGSNPLLQFGYGSYGASVEPAFQSPRLSLLDRGFVFAIAHVRGGQEMGRQWYEDGKLLNKKNTFTDFIDVTDALVAQGYARKDRVFAQGGSAGGLLMGAIANMAPDRYHGIVSNVPFVDVVTTMLDASIPLTTNEYDEWGNPAEKAYYDYMLSYSPYDNIEAKAYPNILVSTGLWDSQVQYFEPAKYVARLRAKKTDQNRLLFHVNMGAGHGGKSGRFARLEDTAREYAFMLDLAR
jgi:oligopeptidase B